MCNWCKKETKMTPQVCGATFPMICEHCGTKVADLDWKELRLWKAGKLKLTNRVNNRKGYEDDPNDVGC